MRNNKGFTLIELLIVVAIIGLLATLAIISLTSAQSKARDTKRVADVKSMQSAVEMYYNDNNTYPSSASWSALATDLTDYLTALPAPPGAGVSGDAYTYAASVGGADYCILTVLENDHQILDQSVSATPSCGLTVDTEASSGTADTTCVPGNYDLCLGS